MLEAQAQILLLVRAFEEADREGHLLTPYARATATRRALRVTNLNNLPKELADPGSERYGETLVRRSRVLFESLERKMPSLRGMIRIAQLGATTGPGLLVLAFVIGLVTNALGPTRRIHLLSLPLLGVIFWNLAIYAWMALSLFRPRMRRLRRLAPWLAERFLRGALWRRLRGLSIGKAPREWKGITSTAMIRFAASWSRAAGSLLAARVRRTLHLAAASLVGGVIVGMYVRGLGLEYRATWESTWLGPGAVHTILTVLLAPASWLLATPIPDVVALRGPGATGDAAPWIHLYAVTVLLYVVAPRLILAAVECWRCHVHLDLQIDLRDAYFRRVLSEWRGATRRVEIVPYSYAPRETTLTSLKKLLQDYFGARADIRARAPMAYGDEPAAVQDLPRPSREPWSPTVVRERVDADLADPERETCHVVLFNMAQSPEAEVHGAFLAGLMGRLEVGHGRLLTVIDSSAYRERVTDPERWGERLRNWERVARDAGAAIVELDPSRAIDDEAVDALGAAIWGGPDAVEAAGAAG